MKSDLTTMRESSIRRLTVLSEQLGAINLSQGFPDEDTYPELKELAHQAISQGHSQYAPPRGALILREGLAVKLQQYNSISADPDRNIVVTCGATEGMMVCIESLLDRGDEVLTFTPMYENYLFQTLPSGVSLACIELTEPEFTFTLQDLVGAVNERTRAILICNPCNPTGKVFTRVELGIIAEVAIRHNLLVFSDETYEYFIWGPQPHISVASLAGMQDRTMTVISCGKTYGVTGWRVGYVVGPEMLLDRVAMIHDFHTITAPHAFQVALAGALRLPQSFYEQLRVEFRSRMRLLKDALFEAGFEMYEPGGSYFLWCSYARLSKDPDVLFCEHLLRNIQVAGVPGSVFYPLSGEPRRRVRFTFSKSKTTLGSAVQRLARLIVTN